MKLLCLQYATGNKHGVSKRWFTEADVKHFKSGALRTITIITRIMVN